MAGEDDGNVTVVDLVAHKVAAVIPMGAYGGSAAVSSNGRAYIGVSPRPFPPVRNTTLATAYLAVAPPALVGPPSYSERPIDPPGEIYVFDTKTFKRIDVPAMKEPSLSFGLAILEPGTFRHS
jgi:hypothetical protein